jgi:ABC-2 type transport system permease protein
MTALVTLATARRVAAQLRRDRRTMAMILVVPPALLALFKYVFDEQPESFARVGTPLAGLFPLIIMFLVTSIAMLRERSSGTLERLMSLPLSKLDLLAGYGLAFAAVAAVQAAVTSAVAFWLLDVQTDGPVWTVAALAIANAILGMASGLFLSAFATSEFQAVQFMPAFLLPQIVLAGLFIPREQMPGVLETIADFLPLTYAFDALAKVAADDIDGRFWLDAGVIGACVALALGLGAMTLRRRTA